MTITVLVVDDQQLIRSALSDLLRSESDINVVGESENGRDAVRDAQRLKPDVILMDIRMPVLDGISATREICDDPVLADTRVVILTTFEQDDNVFDALRAGASGFLGKGLDPAHLAGAVRTVHAGDALLSATATRALVHRVTSTPQHEPPTAHHPGIADLTEREHEILVLLASGLSNDEIAGHLSISTSTAKTHVNRTMTKLWAHDRAQLVIIAYENGLVIPGSP